MRTLLIEAARSGERLPTGLLPGDVLRWDEESKLLSGTRPGDKGGRLLWEAEGGGIDDKVAGVAEREIEFRIYATNEARNAGCNPVIEKHGHYIYCHLITIS